MAFDGSDGSSGDSGDVSDFEARMAAWEADHAEDLEDVVFDTDKGQVGPKEATIQRQRRVWALLAERWASEEEVLLLRQMETTINANVQEIDLDDFGELSRLPAEVRKNLWIGSEADAGNEQWLVQEGIQAVLNCTEEVVSPRRLEIYQKLNIQHLHVAMYDDPSEDLGEVLVKARPWLQQMKDERVLVHCFVGGNRSVAVVILGFPRVLFSSWLTPKHHFQSVYVCLVSLQHLNVFKYIHIIIIVEIFIQMFLTIAPKMISKKTAHQPRISYLVLDEAEDFWDALTKVSFARGRVLGSGSFPLQLLRLLKPTVSDPPELERKAAVASCCHKYSVEVFFCYICETSVYISIIFCTCHPKDSTKSLYCTAETSPGCNFTASLVAGCQGRVRQAPFRLELGM